MDEKWISWVQRQIAASFDMLQVAIETATDQVWDNDDDETQFWRISAHVTFFIDFYFSTFKPDNSNPSESYSYPDFLSKYGKTGLDDLIDEVVTKEEILNYLKHGRNTLKQYFAMGLENQIYEKSGFDWLDMTKGELLLYNMRHIMEHTAILNQILKKHGLPASKWKG